MTQKIIMEKDYIEVNGEKIYFYIQRKKIKNMNLKVNIDKTITISIPLRMPLYKAKEFIKQKANWIKKQQDFYDKISKKRETSEFENGGILYILGNQYKIDLKIDNKSYILMKKDNIEIHIKEKYIENKKYIKSIYDKWLKEYAKILLQEIVKKYQNTLKKYEIKIPEIQIRQMKSKWGCCFPYKNKVVFNLSLIKTPICCVEYVVLHELAHFKHQNHSKKFYDFIAMFMPDWKIRKNILNKEFAGVI